ncbi:MAG TPA: flagellar protein FlgN [Steroidobacteraceae bacterium]
MDAQICREYLAALLSEESGALAQLEELLGREQSVLAAADIAAVEEIARVRQSRIGALARIEEQRRHLCAVHGHGVDRAGLDQLLSWCDPDGSLAARLTECGQRAVRCRDLNDRNGTLVAARLRQVEERLALLTGRSSRAPTYGPKGTPATSHRRRVLGAA